MTSVSPSPAAALSDTLEQAVAHAATSVVRVSSPRGHASSGTVWSADGLILTTHRGTRRAAKLSVLDYRERELQVRVIGRDPSTDLALLRVQDDHAELEPITRAAPDALPNTGALAVALARPGWQIRASLRAVGIVGPGFRTRGGGRVDAWLETDRALPQGFSGGPLIDTRGNMIGLDSRGLVRRADLAIPIATLERVVPELVEHGAVRQGWLGLSLVPVEVSEGRQALLVAGVSPEGPAATAGLRIGDIIEAIAARELGGLGALREALRGQQGQAQQLRIQRGGATLELEITPIDAPRSR